MPAAVVTGGASGFGLALAESCARLGHAVALLDLDGDRAMSEAARLTDTYGTGVFGMSMDVCEPASIEAAVTAVDERLGGANLVISNVGVQLFGSVESISDR